ncbi:MAG: NAD-dependent epimerase/dehydratase family protein [Steroidobacteraceae bacterium]|jgi:nucleoside-diphosphate-sugar epimerase
MKPVLVTGATGFVGGFVCEALARRGHTVRAAVRAVGPLPAHAAESAVIGGIDESTDWNRALDGVDAVVHLAAKAHTMRPAKLASQEFHATNALGTQRLVQAAVKAGVRRFIYLSSVKVNGEGRANSPYTPRDAPNPQDAYAASKWLGEKAVSEIEAGSPPERVIVRAPLVYGPGVRANFLRLMRWVEAGWPLPLGAVHNARSLIGVWNLAHLLVLVLSHPAAAGDTWMASDGQDLSTPALMRQIGAAMGRRVRLLPVPVPLLRLAGGLIGRSDEISRLCNSSTVDISATLQKLDWSAPVSVTAGIERTVQWYRDEGRALVA